VGAVSSQNITLPSLGPKTLLYLEQGLSVDQALAAALATDDFHAYRQVTAMSVGGESACFSGTETLGIHHSVKGDHCIAAGNMLSDQSVIVAMVSAFEAASGALGHRLISALAEGVLSGGEAGPVHSAALKVVQEQAWPIVDLRVDWCDDGPVAELSKLWKAYEPQMQDYVTRALDTRQAPSYGVPGDE
jgi:uncharacterized Ntn-hydrolase superfamily protein